MADHRLLLPTFTALAETLVDDFDLIELLSLMTERCVEIFGVDAAGVMLVGAQHELRVVASSSESMATLEAFEVQSQEGPCIDCYATGLPVVTQLLSDAEQWPRFAPVALAAGFQTVLALPMRLRGSAIGALNLFSTGTEDMPAMSLASAQAIADVATIALVQHRAAQDAHLVSEQLSEALRSRVLIEQAKGVLAERWRVDVDVAFGTMRTHARNSGVRLTDVAQAVIKRTIDLPRPT